MAIPDSHFDPGAFVAEIAAIGRLDQALLGLDPGTKTIGIAISDAGWSLARPEKTLRRTKLSADARTIIDLIERETIAGLVIGMPFNMDGTAGPRAQSVRAFRRALSGHIDLPMLYWDERLSSHAADETLRQAGQSARQRQDRLDAAAAAHILEDSLPTLRDVRTEHQRSTG